MDARVLLTLMELNYHFESIYFVCGEWRGIDARAHFCLPIWIIRDVLYNLRKGGLWNCIGSRD